MKNLILSLFITLGLTGCVEQSQAKYSDSNIGRNALTYFQDKNTGLCFAQIGDTEFYSYAMTCVPCSEKVKAKLINP